MSRRPHLLILACALASLSCSGPGDGRGWTGGQGWFGGGSRRDGNDEGASSSDADTFTNDPVLQQAIAASGYHYNLGSNPPTITGKYETSGKVTKSSGPAAGTPGEAVASTYCYYNQRGARIDSVESVPGYQSVGPGLVITGDGAAFTTWKDAHVTDSTGCVQRTFVLFSATRGSDGTLTGNGLTTVVEANSSCSGQPGMWRTTNMVFTPAGTCSGP